MAIGAHAAPRDLVLVVRGMQRLDHVRDALGTVLGDCVAVRLFPRRFALSVGLPFVRGELLMITVARSHPWGHGRRLWRYRRQGGLGSGPIPRRSLNGAALQYCIAERQHLRFIAYHNLAEDVPRV